MCDCRTKIRITAQRLADCQQSRFRAKVRIKSVVLRTTDSTEQNRIGLEAGIESLLGKRMPGFVYRHSTNQSGSEFEVITAYIRYCSEHLYRLAGNLRTDSVARKNCNS